MANVKFGKLSHVSLPCGIKPIVHAMIVQKYINKIRITIGGDHGKKNTM